jgi:FdrA protein
MMDNKQLNLHPALETLVSRGPVAVNLGLSSFAEALRAQGAKVLQVDWTPPASGDEELSRLLDKLL